MRTLSALVLVLSLVTAAANCGGDKAPRQPVVTTTGTPTEEVLTAAISTEEPLVYLVGLGNFPERMLERLQAFFEDEHGIAVGILPEIPLTEESFDRERRQLVADRLLESIDQARGERRDIVVIGLTEDDIMMLGRPDWAFVFSFRDESMGLAVVSAARFDPRNFGERRDNDLLFDRTAKMVGKSIGGLHLGLPLSDDPHSVMYNQLFSLDAVDSVDDDFRLTVAP